MVGRNHLFRPIIFAIYDLSVLKLCMNCCFLMFINCHKLSHIRSVGLYPYIFELYVTSVDDAKTVATATMLSRLDYCNSILIQPQQTTTCAERPSAHRHDDENHNIRLVLANLHGLPITARIQFK